MQVGDKIIRTNTQTGQIEPAVVLAISEPQPRSFMGRSGEVTVWENRIQSIALSTNADGQTFLALRNDSPAFVAPRRSAVEGLDHIDGEVITVEDLAEKRLVEFTAFLASRPTATPATGDLPF